ncbi:Protein of unknown function [Cotesia congregata]|uniref:Thioredoxin domain-containing protein 17 n=1 Tax=Cotesia congregata TaxID=51543 RepID=A0A8J2HDV4_COTCN|nr:Protein of unknown function [Cotesia congregata]
MVVKHHVEGYENFLSLMENLKADGPIIVLYSGSKLENGLSWCSDCVEGIVVECSADDGALGNTEAPGRRPSSQARAG